MQCKVEMLESEYPFQELKMLPPQRIGKEMSKELFNETKSLFEDRFCHLSIRFDKFAHCKVNGMCLSSAMNRSDRSGRALAYWAINEEDDMILYFCKIQYFFNVQMVILNESGAKDRKVIPFAYVDWYRSEK